MQELAILLTLVVAAVFARLWHARREGARALRDMALGIGDGRAVVGEVEVSGSAVVEDAGGVLLGWGERRGASGGVVLEPVFWDFEGAINPHFLVLGASGSGKTQTLRMLSWELGRRGYPVLVIDFSGDQEVEGEKAYRFVLGGAWGINPLEFHKDPRSGGPGAQRYAVVRAISETFAPMGVVQVSILDEAVRRAYERRRISDDPKTWDAQPPTMADVRRELEAMAEERAAKSSAKSQRGKEKERKRKTPEDHLRSKISPIFDSKVFEGRSVDVAIHRPGVLRLDVSKLPWELQRLVAEFVLFQVFRREMLLGHRERVERFVVIDEAKLAMPRRGAAASQWAIVNRVVSEGRKYGVGIIMATQSAEHLTPDVRRNIGTKLLLRHDETEFGATRRRFPGVEVGLLRTLDRPGVGLLVDGVGVKRIRVRGYDFRDLGR